MNLAGVALAVGATALLCGAGAGHSVHLNSFRQAVSTHRVLPQRTQAPIAVLVPIVEVMVGVWLALALAGWTTPLYAIVAAAALFAAMAGYGAAVHATGSVVPCGCGQADVPLNAWTWWRTAALAVGLVAVAAFIKPSPLVSLGLVDSTVALFAGGSLAVLTWLLPQSMHVPGRTPTDKFALLR